MANKTADTVWGLIGAVIAVVTLLVVIKIQMQGASQVKAEGGGLKNV
jgi:hypothetical protein